MADRSVGKPGRAPLVLLAVCVFFAICTEMLPVGLLPEIGQGLGASTAATSVPVSLYAVLAAALGILALVVLRALPAQAASTAEDGRRLRGGQMAGIAQLGRLKLTRCCTAATGSGLDSRRCSRPQGLGGPAPC